MFKNIEKQKELVEKRKFYLGQMKEIANLYENSNDEKRTIIESILKTLGSISLSIKEYLDKFDKIK